MLNNNVLAVSWKISGTRQVPLGIVNRERPSTEKEGYDLPSSRFVMEGPPAISALKGRTASPLLGERKEGTAISVTFRDKKSELAVH